MLSQRLFIWTAVIIVALLDHGKYNTYSKTLSLDASVELQLSEEKNPTDTLGYLYKREQEKKKAMQFFTRSGPIKWNDILVSPVFDTIFLFYFFH